MKVATGDEERRENWKRAKDQPQYANPENKCLHCAGNHRSHDCPTRHQHQAPPATKSFTPTTFPVESVYSWIINTDIDG